MGTPQQQIVSKFLERLAKSKHVDVGMVAQVRKLHSEGEKPKADSFVRLFSLPAGRDVK